jgi:hypothetical protein
MVNEDDSLGGREMQSPRWIERSALYEGSDTAAKMLASTIARRSARST